MRPSTQSTTQATLFSHSPQNSSQMKYLIILDDQALKLAITTTHLVTQLATKPVNILLNTDMTHTDFDSELTEMVSDELPKENRLHTINIMLILVSDMAAFITCYQQYGDNVVGIITDYTMPTERINDKEIHHGGELLTHLFNVRSETKTTTPLPIIAGNSNEPRHWDHYRQFINVVFPSRLSQNCDELAEFVNNIISRCNKLPSPRLSIAVATLTTLLIDDTHSKSACGSCCIIS